METVREKMIRLIDMLIAEVEKIEKKENQTPEEIAALPTLVDSILNITGYAVIEKKTDKVTG